MNVFGVCTIGFALIIYSEYVSADICSTETEFNNACKFGNMTLTTFKGINFGKEKCNEIVNISQLAAPPVVSIHWPNRSELFTVLMIDIGQLGNGPYYLQWLVTNVTADQLVRLSFPSNRILAQYEVPSLPPTQKSAQYYEVIAFRQNSTFRNYMPEVHSVHRRAFNLRKWVTGATDNVKLCGPVAGIQFRSKYENTNTIAPSPGFVYPGPINYPNVAVQPGYPPQAAPAPGWAPNPPQAPAPGWAPNAGGNQGQTSWASPGVNVPNGQTPPKKSSGSTLRAEAIVIAAVLLAFILSSRKH